MRRPPPVTKLPLNRQQMAPLPPHRAHFRLHRRDLAGLFSGRAIDRAVLLPSKTHVKKERI
ncbi:hypothetical protein IE4771_CH02815 [Rhizobium etli bv. mimosae str. IE4771]|uniref:Uncharacterized protein n=1 Tax=Rhizobium etli bv. mimosae str. IE4771 TaxID=1432050 RepID=A0A060HY81_RHIET|nr:hypothetical protein IE4771_CH02815 [Rhizobium sp. IE4771]